MGQQSGAAARTASTGKGRAARTAKKQLRGLVVEKPAAKPPTKPSWNYIEALRELGAAAETVELAEGKRKFRRHFVL